MKRQDNEVGKLSLYRANTPVLSIRALGLTLSARSKKVAAKTIFDSLKLDLFAGKITGIFGEAGSGKSLFALSIMALLPSDQKWLLKGSIIFEGNDLRQIGAKKMTELYANKLSMIFQNPSPSLNPYQTIAKQVARAGQIHHQLDARQAKERVSYLLELLGIEDVKTCMSSYPHQLTVDQCRLIMQAIAMSCSPQVLIADDPFPRVDSKGIEHSMSLLKAMTQEFNTSILILSDKKELVSKYCDNTFTLSPAGFLEGILD